MSKENEIKFDTGLYRYDAAAYLKSIFQAREKDAPGFVTSEMIKRWNLDEGCPPGSDFSEAIRNQSKYYTRRCLRFARERLPILCGTVDESDVNVTQDYKHFWKIGFEEGTIRNSLRAVCDFSSVEALNAAYSAADNNQSIDWDNLANWDAIDLIRDGLDSFPHPAEYPPATCLKKSEAKRKAANDDYNKKYPPLSKEDREAMDALDELYRKAEQELGDERLRTTE